MGFLDEMKEAYQEGYDGADKVLGKFDKKKDGNEGPQSTNEGNATSEKPAAAPAQKKSLIGQIVCAAVLGVIGFLFLGILGLVIGAAIGFFAGGFILGLIKKATPQLYTEEKDKD